MEANAEDKQLEVYLKRSAYTDLPGLVFEAEMPGTTEEEQNESPTGPGGEEEKEEEEEPSEPDEKQVEEDDYNTFGKLIIDKIWEHFKQVNPSCQEE